MSGAFLELVQRRKVPIVVKAFERAIAASFEADKSRMTRAEVRRRFDICASVFGQLRRDVGWSTERILDHLPGLLRAELDGIPWAPDTRGAWSAPEENRRHG